LSPTACSKTPPLNARRAPGASLRKQRRSEPSNVPASPVLPADQTTGGGSGATNEPRKTPEVQLNSMDRAVGVVLSAKRFMVRFRSSVVVPYKPDTPVPPDMQPPDIQIHRTSVKEPIRFVYEGPMPYTRNTGLQLKPTMNHLRVPGRPPPNVPQTIIEEDPVLITPPTTPPSPGTGLEHQPPLRHRAPGWNRRRRQLVDGRTRRRGSLLPSSTLWKSTPRTPRTCVSNVRVCLLSIITELTSQSTLESYTNLRQAAGSNFCRKAYFVPKIPLGFGEDIFNNSRAIASGRFCTTVVTLNFDLDSQCGGLDY